MKKENSKKCAKDTATNVFQKQPKKRIRSEYAQKVDCVMGKNMDDCK